MKHNNIILYTYDRIVLTDNSDLTGDSGVFRYDMQYGLDEKLTTDVSDQYPVYVDFWIGNDSM